MARTARVCVQLHSRPRARALPFARPHASAALGIVFPGGTRKCLSTRSPTRSEAMAASAWWSESFVRHRGNSIVPALITMALIGAVAPRIVDSRSTGLEPGAPTVGLPRRVADLHSLEADFLIPDGLTRGPYRKVAAVAYDSISIVTPKDDETVFDNSGNVVVTVMLSPALQSAAGDRITILVDGIVTVKGQEPRLQVSGLVRGAHTLEAGVVNKDGERVISSAPVTFYMWQASRLFRNHR